MTTNSNLIKMRDAIPNLEMARSFLAAGQLDQAEAVLRLMVADHPDDAEAWHLLAGAAHQAGNDLSALEHVRRAIASAPEVGVFHASLGLILAALGRADEAIQAYQRALSLQPDLAGAHNNLGNLLRKSGQADQAIDAFGRALALRPDHAEARTNLAQTLAQMGRAREALEQFRRVATLRPMSGEAHVQLAYALRDAGQPSEAALEFQKALALQPDSFAAMNGLGIVLRESGRVSESVAAHQRAIALRPSESSGYVNLGCALEKAGDIEQAAAVLEKALELEPNSPEAHQNLANVLRAMGHPQEALDECRIALALRPEFSEAQAALGNVLMDLGLLEEAVAAHRRALELRPAYDEVRFNLALTLLLAGNFEEGWPAFEIRRQIPALRVANFDQPMWDGSDFYGRTLLLHAEQGMGDTIQFIRYVPLVAERGGNVIVRCQPALKALLTGQPGIRTVLADTDSLPPFDLHCPLMSVPLVLGTRERTIPSTTPYLFADRAAARHWRERLREAGPFRKIGLAWAGSRHHRNDRNRSMSLQQFSLLRQVKNAMFISLQKGEPARQALHPPEGLSLIDWTAELNDWTDTAALASSLDLVITVDTAVAHLAGAMGKEVWVLLPFSPDWRWMLKRSDSPWYPTMRLFRQPTPGNWETPIRQVVEELTTKILEAKCIMSEK